MEAFTVALTVVSKVVYKVVTVVVPTVALTGVNPDAYTEASVSWPKPLTVLLYPRSRR